MFYEKGGSTLNIFRRWFRRKVSNTEKSYDQDNYIYTSNSQLTPDEAQAYWEKVARKLIVGAINSVDHTAERIFILVSFDDKMPSIDMFFQMNGQIRMWNDLDNAMHKRVISNSLVTQAPNVVKQVNCVYNNAGLTRLAYAQVQYEFESKTWYLHDVTQNSIESQLDKEPAFLKWFDDVSKCVEGLPLDSKHKITWGPFKPEF